MTNTDQAIALEVIGAGKAFGAFRALDAVSLKVAPGTVHALLGAATKFPLPWPIAPSSAATWRAGIERGGRGRTGRGRSAA